MGGWAKGGSQGRSYAVYDATFEGIFGLVPNLVSVVGVFGNRNCIGVHSIDNWDVCGQVTLDAELR